ncbi:MAG: rhomboid family intramembrane serine protease [Colwellia sp.]|nr:rhomboid family intramembrane serine protease [Colwellia sp.]
MKIPVWLYPSALPRNDHDFFKILLEKKEQFTSDIEMKEHLKSWQPQQSWLINIAGFSRMLPPIYRKELQQHIIKNLKRRHQLMAIGYLIPALIFLVIFMLFGFEVSALGWSLVFVSLSLLYTAEYRLGLSQVKGIKERALFFYWLYNSKAVKRSLLVCATFGLFIGSLQLLLNNDLGSEEDLFRLYGVMYESLSNHEYWRLLTGPNLHYSMLHFFNNFLMLLMIGTLCISLIGYKSVLVFFVGNAIGAYFQFLLGSQELNNCGGISFGVYSLFGLMLGFNLCVRQILPQGFAISLFIIVLIGLLFSELLISNSASVGHFTGLLFGVISNLLFLRATE